MDAGQMNYVGLLNEFATKKGWVVDFQEETAGPDHIRTFTMRVVINGEVYPEGVGPKKKEAKENAAKNALAILKKDELDTTETSSESSATDGNGEENLSIQSLSLHNQQQSTTMDTENTSADVNFIELLNQYCQKHKLVNGFRAVEKKGPAHVPEFAVRVVINNKEYPEERGGSMKEARQKAAQLAFNELGDSALSSQNSSMSVSPYPANSSEWLSSSPPVSSPTTKSRFLEDFDTISRIGKGGYGRVFKARRKLEDAIYAVKIVTFTDKACREVQALSRLCHANIVRYHSSWTEETEYRDETSDTSSGSHSGSGSKFLYIQMEFCVGETLKMWIDERNDNPEKYPTRRLEAADIIKQVLEAVKYIHSNKLFHRDLKPLNIMFGQDGGVKVGDFGLVSKEERDDDGPLLERTQKAGTSFYMSPEQRLRQKNYGRKVDIYAAGLIFFELLWRFGTITEKDKQWVCIRSKNFPKEFCITFIFEHKLIKGMLCEDPAKRPEASDLLTKLDKHSGTTATTKHEYRTY